MWSWIKNASENNSTLYFDEAGHFKVKVTAPILVNDTTGSIEIKTGEGLYLNALNENSLDAIIGYEEVNNG